MNFLDLAKKYEDRVIGIRHELHRHPELSSEEKWTTDRICQELDRIGLEYKRFEPSGVICDIKGNKPGNKTVALRADIDALPQTEQTGLEFSSETPGKMHACGHDTHAAMLLGAAMIINDVRDEFGGTIRLLFQPGEEGKGNFIPGEEPMGGAQFMCKMGALEGVDAIFGQHIGPREGMTGYYVYNYGASAASANKFTIKIHGKATHGAFPQTGADASVAAAAVVMALQTLVSRDSDPFKPLVVTIGQINSGSVFNIISGEATIIGTVRTFDREFNKNMPEMMQRIASNVAAGYKCTAEVIYEVNTEVLINDDTMTDVAKAAAEKIVGSDKVFRGSPTMGGEDFAEYTKFCPAAFVNLVCSGKYPNHSNFFTVDEAGFKYGSAFLTQVAFDYLEKYND
ncbi:MAG: amidohydrolase [Oscillospiraceae bacterium]|nr:amidohydrolase [Oscillospiraceae bacterium]